MRLAGWLGSAALIAALALPRAESAIEGLQADLRRNLTCTVAAYAALDVDATEADLDRAEELCRR